MVTVWYCIMQKPDDGKVWQIVSDPSQLMFGSSECCSSIFYAHQSFPSINSLQAVWWSDLYILLLWTAAAITGHLMSIIMELMTSHFRPCNFLFSMCFCGCSYFNQLNPFEQINIQNSVGPDIANTLDTRSNFGEF